jgi:hypothetical protein
VVPNRALYDAVGELALSLLLASIFWAPLVPRHWTHYPDRLALLIALLIELSAIAGVLHALSLLLT